MKTKITRLLEQLGQGLVEREQTLKLALLTVLAGENLVLVGPPGTGKSLVARRVAQSLSGDGPASHFEYLLTKFSTPEELFGPLSISALKADRFHRNTAGYLPTVRIAFLDEIFKASSSILNALLTILNERVYHNGTEVQPVPLQSLIAASNELPADQEELAALYDRFLVRVFVDYVGTSNLSRLFEPTTEPTLPPQDLLTAQDLAQIRQAANQVVFEPALIHAVQDIWAAHKETFKEDRRERLSDRRLKKVIHLMRVSAATNGREAVDLSDLLLLKDCLWSHPDNASKVRDLINQVLLPKKIQTDEVDLASIYQKNGGKIIDVRVPQLSESVAEATLISWGKKVGEFVGLDEILIEVETDKVVLEVPSPAAGVLLEISVGDGGAVSSNQVIAKILISSAPIRLPSKINAVHAESALLPKQIGLNIWL